MVFLCLVEGAVPCPAAHFVNSFDGRDYLPSMCLHP